MQDVAIVGVGCTPVGEPWDKSLREIAVDSTWNALDDAGTDEVDGLIVGNMSSGNFIDQESLGSLIADYGGLGNISAFKVEGACGSAGAAFKAGVMAVASGYHDVVCVTGVEKMTDVVGNSATKILANACDREYEAIHGVTFVGLNAMIMKRYMHDHKVTREQISTFPVNSHKNGVKNPNAMFRREISLDTVLNSPMVADPLTVMDCAPICDGAASVILTTRERAREFTDTPVIIKGCSVKVDTIGVHDRATVTSMAATKAAAKDAFAQAKMEPKDIQTAELHDAFSIMGVIGLEDLGFVPAGKGAKFAADGEIAIGGKLPCCTMGGLKARGHPVGATGVYQIVELAKNIRGDGVIDVENGIAQNIGGTGSTVSVAILGRDD
ncbi:thiolase domain-containing protein [archaeon]|nr:MAG: thiolase domain-containing protein [archaeon]